ncbi:MAG: MarR family transcriptional regulator [Fervidobacterium sp.]|nr:MarR family transcriptional regulator [Fervidobacterium sp.]
MKGIVDQNSILYKMSVLQRKIFKIINESISRTYSIHPGQIPMLFLIQNHPGISQRDISKLMDVEPGTVAVMLKRMEKNKLVYREEDVKDRRISRVYLSSKAQEVLESVHKTIRQIETLLISGLTESEQKQLEELIDKLRRKIDEQFEQKKAGDDAC